MSLAELFYAKHPRRTWFSRLRKSSRKGSGSVTPSPSGVERTFRLEPLEPRVLLSATPTEVVAPQEVITAALTGPANGLANLDVDLNGRADALSDGILIIRHLFGFTGTALTDGAVDPTGQRTDPAAISTYLNQFKTTMLDVDLNGRADALSDGILIIRNLFGFIGSALTDGAVDPAGARTSAAAIATFLNNMNPAVELIPPVVAQGLASDTGLSATDHITSNPAIAGSISDLNAIASFRAGFDATLPAAFTSILSDLSANGTFSLTTTRLDQLSGGTLSDGTHTLHLQATDSRGNVSLTDFTFTLDRQAPGIAGVGLSAGSDTGTPGDNITAAAKVLLTGTTEAGATVTLGSTNVLAPGTGAFQIPDVALVSGANLFSLTSSDLAGNSSTASLTITRAGVATADVALAWNQLTLDAIRLSVVDPPIATRILAMVSLAQFDTLAAIENTPAYLIHQSVTGPVSVDAALAKAAHTVLYDVFPAQRATFDAALNSLLAGIADGAAKTTALTLGQAIGQGILAVRANDGSGTFVDYPGGSPLGQWRPDAPMFDVADEPQWGGVTPFALTSGDQFRPAAPPALDSAAYAASVEEVRGLGSATSATRTADQTQIAQFWADGKGSYTPPGHWDLIAAQIAQQQGNSLSANVRLFAQLNVALADAGVAAWDAKYTYGLWRPIDAIQQADLDNNPGTSVDAVWTPLLITPSHPEYVSGHSTFSSAAATILAAAFGNNTAFSTTAFTLSGVSRTFTSFTQAAQEAGRSRIYGGIHYEFTNQAGQQLGQEVGNAVLARFALNADVQAPTIIANSTPASAKTNLTFSGQILDNISGVALAQFRIDSGALQTLTLGSQGQFTITTTFALDGTADGVHTISILAKDAANNSAPTFTRSFILDTILPAITLDSIADNTVINVASRLAGTANPTGSPLTQLIYKFDNGSLRTVFFNNTTGAFDGPLFTGNLTVGAHQLIMTATDAAGNQTTLTRNVTLNQAIPFTITSVTPVEGALDVGVTYQPQIVFSRAVNTASLTSDSLYAVGADGQKISATIVAALDGSFAWLFFTNPLPGGSTITIKADGNLITAAADQQVLDGNGDGTPGGLFTRSFTTVSTVSVPGTKLVGKVVDPGPDLLPGTFDDMRRGPDGIIHTPDDVFLLPIIHAKVFILGREDQFVFTDANGDFELTDVPVGNVKIAIDGRTATNTPTGLFFPEMVMDANLLPGITNTIMGSMAMDNNQQGLANLDRKEVYLPRLQTNILQNVSNTDPTTVTVDANSAPNLTDQERQSLTLTITPGSAIGADGLPLANAQIGVSTVPEELVQDMLPAGVLQHTFDITIQAPGVSTFAQPLQITFPNVFNAAPGEKLFVLSFDHTTGRLVINGTATVSADGLTVVADADSGIKAPGWHGLTPPGPRGRRDAPVPPGPPPPPLPPIGPFPPPPPPWFAPAPVFGPNVPPPPPPTSTGTVIVIVAPPNNGAFGPTVVFTDNSLSNPQQAIVNQVATFVKTIIVGDLPSVVLSNGILVDDILIEVKAQNIDGVGNTLAQTSVDEVRSSGPGLPAKATIVLDTADLTNPNLSTIVLHQFLHALGFGSLFQSLGLVNLTNPVDPLFTGTNATAEFQVLAGGAPAGVPLENLAGQLPEHWRESVFDKELMTAFLDLAGPFPLSRVTIAALKDMGYVVNMNAADPFALPVTPAAGSQGTLGTLVIDAAIPTPAAFSRAYRLGASAPSDLPGFDPVTLANVYSDLSGFGWQPASVSSLSIVAGPQGSIVKGSNAQFSVAVPNGIYELSLTLGGDTIAHDAMTVVFEGLDRGLVSTKVGELIATQYRVAVFDGKLDLQVTPNVGGTVALHSLQLNRLRDNVASASASTISGTFFVAIEDLSTGNVMRHSITLDPGEPLCPEGVVFAPNTSYREWVYHLESGTVGFSDFTTPTSGVNFTMPVIQVGENIGQDGDADGLSDVAEFIIGTTDLKRDTDGDGASDYAEIHARTNPLDGRPAVTGTLASVVLKGEAKAVSAEQGAGSNTPIVAVATGSFGVAFVDVTQADRPVVLREVDLAGDSTDVAFDGAFGIAAVASNAGGLNLVDLNGVVRNIAINPSVVEIIDSFAYVNNGGDLMSFDMVTGDLLQTLTVGFSPIIAMAHEGQKLYTIDASQTLRAFDVSSGTMIARGSLALPAAAAKMFVGGGVAYIGAETGFTGGYMTVNVANSNSLTLISGVDSTSIAGKAIALNGSGLAVSVGSLAFIGGAPNFLQLLNAADPAVTDGFISQFTLTADPFDVAIASGMAFVADGTGGLVVVNYKSADNLGIGPTISLTSQAIDLDPIAPGIQVQEGTIFQVIPTVTDDVQVSRVDLLVNGQLVRSDVSFPWDLLATTPAIAVGGTTLTVRAIATDTGGNATTSAPLTFTVVPDTFAPTIVDTKPTNAAKPFFVPSIDVRFSEAINQSLLNLSGLHLVNLGGDKLAGTGDDINIGITSFIVRDRGTLLSMVPAVELTQGDYRLTVDPAVIADAAGNHIGTPLVVNFTIRPASDVHALSGVPKIFQAPSANVGQDIGIGFPGADSGLLLVVPTMDQSGNPGTVQVGISHIDTNTGQAFFVVPAAAVTGDINTTHAGQSNYSTFPQWNVTRGTVDLIGLPLGGSAFNDVVPGNGLYVDMDGSNSQAGRLESKTTFNLAPGTYELSFKLAPSEGGTSPTNTVTVSLGGAFSESITRANNANQTFETFVRTITVSSTASGKLVFDQTNTGDNFGLYLDDVKLTNVTTGQVLLQDNFDFTLVDGAIPLQIVPVVTNADLTFVNTTQANFTLSGSGFIEGNGTQYQLGTVVLLDAVPTTGPDVFSTNARANLNGLAFTDDLFGAVVVTTAGGMSAPFSVGYTELVSTAFSGTPAQAGQPSANPGQVVTVRGTGLSLTTDLVARYVADNTGVAVVEGLNPFYVNATGTEAQVALPSYYNGAFTLHVVGSSFAPLLQIVPVVTGIDVTGTTNATVQGFGFTEGNGTVYQWAGGNLIDTAQGVGPDVFSSATRANVTAPVHGFGNFTMTTSGGTSAPLAVNHLNVGELLRDLAYDPTTGQLWIATNDNPAQIHRLNPATGVSEFSFNLTAGGFGTTNFFGGLQILPSNMTLHNTATNTDVLVLAGSLLIINGQANPDRIIAVDPLTGAVLASLTLNGVGQNYDATAGLYDPTSGHLFLASFNRNPDQLFEVDPATGAQRNAFNLPFDINHGGLALDPVSNNFWIGSSLTNTIAEITRTGVVVRQVDLSVQGVNGGEISGLSFHSDGDLLVSSDQGVVYKVNRNFTLAQPTNVTITGIVALAEDGTPASAGQASANVAQVIEITGTGFGPGTQVLFETRDNAGTTGVIAVGPTAINAAGTRMQVIVPDLAATGTVTVRTIGVRNLGFGGTVDAIYRTVTVDFTATGAAASVQFSDEGLQSIADESWGLDNVRVAPVAAPGSPVFTDTFEGGASAAWSDATTDASLPGTFTQFSGRHNGIQTLNLTGLTNGTAYRMTFDLYVLDSWDGNQPSSGPDILNVFVDGQQQFHEAFSSGLGVPQTYTPNVVGDVLLQIVPVVTGLANGKPGEATVFNLLGSGFMEGASMITIGGVARLDAFTNQSDSDVTGTRNSSYQFVTPLTVEGPIRVTTAGGFHQISGPTFGLPAFVELTGILTTATQGAVANGAQASANAGQAIVLTGNGFTSSTLVQFDAQDDQGINGTLTRTGTANAAGTQLTVIVPALARTGNVRIVGDSDTALALQIVPTLRSMGGTIVAGGQLLLEGTGLVEGGLTITIDGQLVTTKDVRTILDNDTVGLPNGFLDQQLVQLTVPNLVTAGVVRVITTGGSFTMRPATPVTIAPTLTLATEIGDTLAEAQALTVNQNSQLTVNGSGLNINVNLDVDLFSFTANAGDVLTVDVTRLTGTQRLRLFTAAGVELAADSFSGPNSSPQLRNLIVPVTGTYYLGVSGSNNTAYNPAVAGSGVSGNTGTYTLTVRREDAVVSAITGITATATSGTATQGTLPSANTGQTITLTGTGFVVGDQVVFTTVDNSGRLSVTSVVTPTTIAADGLSLTVVVPANAATGVVRLAREQAGQFLQIVPTLTSFDDFSTVYHGGFIRFTGTGISEQGVAVQFGGTTLTDSGPFTGLDAFSNTTVDVSVVPLGVPTGPFRIQTLGGTSAAFGSTFTGMTATATSGTPANGAASANPGQAITLTGTGLSLTTDVIFQVSNPNNGVVSEQLVNPTAINGTTDITVLVPTDAITGPVQIVGDQLNSAIQLQIVPVVTGVDLTFVNTAQANFTLSGFGLIEGTGTRYQLGTVSIVDPGISTGPDAFSSNTRANLNGLAFTDDLFGAVVVTTAGGMSAPFSVSYTQLLSSPAVTGTPVDVLQPSANPGQTVTIVGTGLTLQTDIVARYIADNTGLLVVDGLNPTSVNGTGTQAVVTLPAFYNGGFALNVVGSSFSPILQVIPVVTGIDVTGVGTAQISGQGFTEGNGTVYQWAGGSLTDTAQGVGPDVFTSATRSNVALPVHGFGPFTMTTSGGTSVPIPVNFAHLNQGQLIDVAFNAANNVPNGEMLVADNAEINRIDPVTGATIGSFDIPTTTSTNRFGMQILSGPIVSLGGTAVLAGNLLIMDGSASPDRFTALDPTTGAQLATVAFAVNLDGVAGVFHPGRGTLFVLDDNPNQFVEIDPANGAQIGAAKATPFDINFGGLAVDPVTSNLWIASSSVNTIAEINPATGAVVRTIDLATQGLTNEASGLAFDASNRLLVSSTNGVVYRVDIPGVTISSESAAPLTAGLATSSASDGSIDTSLAVAFTQQAPWLSNFVNGGTSQKADDEELVIALPV